MRTMDFVKGMGLGMVAGAAIGMVVAPQKKKCKSVMGRALKTAGNLVESLSETMGL